MDRQEKLLQAVRDRLQNTRLIIEMSYKKLSETRFLIKDSTSKINNTVHSSTKRTDQE